MREEIPEVPIRLPAPKGGVAGSQEVPTGTRTPPLGTSRVQIREGRQEQSHPPRPDSEQPHGGLMVCPQKMALHPDPQDLWM